MANLFKMADDYIQPLRDELAERLLRVGAFCIKRNGKERSVKPLNREPRYINPADEGTEYKSAAEPIPDENYDSLVVDGFPGTVERIENLAQYYAENGDKLDRRGNEISPAKSSPSVLTDSETADRLIETAVRWQGPQTPFIELIRELIAAELGS